MRKAEDFTGGKITHRVSRATESMSQSVALMIFDFNSDGAIRGGEHRSVIRHAESKGK
jgi:hypothetical protein